MERLRTHFSKPAIMTLIETIKSSVVEFNEKKGMVSCYFSISHSKKDEFIKAVEQTKKSPYGFWILYDNCDSCGKGNYHAELIRNEEEGDYLLAGIKFVYIQASENEIHN